MINLKRYKEISTRAYRGKMLPIMGLLTVCLSLLLISCINDVYDDEPTQTTPGVMYLSINVTSLSDAGSRSQTTTSGESTDKNRKGWDRENKIEKAYLYFYDQSGKLAASFFATTIISSDSPYKVAAKMEETHLLALAGKKLNLYVLANITLDNPYYAKETDLLEAKFNVTEGSQFLKKFYTDSEPGQYCPLTNYEKYEVDLSNVKGDKEKTLELMKKLFTETYETENGTADLWEISDCNTELFTGKGPVNLERSVARLDFKDGSGSTLPGGCVYQIPGAKGPNGDVYLKLYALQLFNISKETYFFRHTVEKLITEGGEDEDPQVFGVEKGSTDGTYNWIYDTDWNFKKTTNPKSDQELGGETEHFWFQPQIDDNGNWMIPGSGTDISGGMGNVGYNTTEAILERYTDGNNEWVYANNGYTPWHYIPENTLPSTDKMTLPFSTGINFLMKVCDANGNELTSEGYGESYRITLSDGSYQDIPWREDVEAESSGFYLNYRYLIEHNREKDDKINGNTGTAESLAPMQIGIVRNNIYQLSVTAVKGLPDPEKPSANIAVAIKVLPWVKRDITVGW